MVAAMIEGQTGLRSIGQKVLFEDCSDTGIWPTYDIAPDGRFLMLRETVVPRINILVNWFEELKRLLPAGK